jgi:hypothetical protein
VAIGRALPTSLSRACGVGPSLSPLEGRRGAVFGRTRVE